MKYNGLLPNGKGIIAVFRQRLKTKLCNIEQHFYNIFYSIKYKPNALQHYNGGCSVDEGNITVIFIIDIIF